MNHLKKKLNISRINMKKLHSSFLWEETSNPIFIMLIWLKKCHKAHVRSSKIMLLFEDLTTFFTSSNNLGFNYLTSFHPIKVHSSFSFSWNIHHLGLDLVHYKKNHYFSLKFPTEKIEYNSIFIRENWKASQYSRENLFIHVFL